jgi:hypothetical protein
MDERGASHSQARGKYELSWTWRNRGIHWPFLGPSVGHWDDAVEFK